MKYYATASILALAGLAAAELPQEHSHASIVSAVRTELNKNNPLEIVDPIFSLLGNKAAAEGAGKVATADLDCLQQIIADQAFTNAKADGNLDGQVNALLFRAIERNTASVGLANVACTTVKATNPEIAAITQVQDAASTEGKAGNKQAILDLAVQIAAIGGDPTLANKAGTFAPGKIGDPTAKGNTCDDDKDVEGCIFSQNLLVEEATAAEIQAAVAAAGTGTGNAAAGNSTSVVGGSNSTVSAPVSNSNSTAGNNNNNNAVATGSNIQSFTGSLGVAAPAVTFTSGADRPFEVNGNTFTTADAALKRSCDIQNNGCFNAANSKAIDAATSECSAQQQACVDAIPASIAAVARRKRAAKLMGRRLGNVRRQSLDFGSCTNPAIKFAAGLDGRKESAFAPAGDFNHGSALAPGVVTSFICGQLQSRCKASADAVAACNKGAAAANSLKAQAAVTAFNSALGL